MAATATARKTATRRAHAQPARRRAAPQPRPARRARKRQLTPPAGFVPVAVGAVGGLADSGVVVRLTRGRLWIGALAALLVGIVALNVIALSFSASSSQAGRQADALKRENSALRGKIATLTASQEVQRTASDLGLYGPKPNEIGYLRPTADDAATAAKRLRDGELTASAVAPVDPAAVPLAALTETAAPAATAPATDPAATDAAAIPVAETPAPTVPSTDPAAASVGGAVTAP